MTDSTFGGFVKSYAGECEMAKTHVILTVAEYNELENARRDRDECDGAHKNLLARLQETMDQLRSAQNAADLRARTIEELRTHVTDLIGDRDRAEDLAHTRKLAIGDLRSRVTDAEKAANTLRRVASAAKDATERGDRRERELREKIAKLERTHEYYLSMARDYWRLRMELGTHPGQVVDRMHERSRRYNHQNTPKERPNTEDIKLFPGFSVLYDADKAPEARADWDAYYGTDRYEVSDSVETPFAVFPAPRHGKTVGFFDLFPALVDHVSAEEKTATELERLRRRVDYLEKVRAILIKRVWGHFKHGS